MEKSKLIIIIVVWNIFVFLLYGFDKLKAKTSGWRVSEKTLLGTAFMLGGIGAFFGMNVFRHKTKHTKFKVAVPIALVITIVVAGYIYFA